MSTATTCNLTTSNITVNGALTALSSGVTICNLSSSNITSSNATIWGTASLNNINFTGSFTSNGAPYSPTSVSSVSQIINGNLSVSGTTTTSNLTVASNITSSNMTTSNMAIYGSMVYVATSSIVASGTIAASNFLGSNSVLTIGDVNTSIVVGIGSNQQISTSSTHLSKLTGFPAVAVFACCSETAVYVPAYTPAVTFRVPFIWNIVGTRASLSVTSGSGASSAVTIDICKSASPMTAIVSASNIFSSSLAIAAGAYTTVQGATSGVLKSIPVQVPDDNVISCFISTSASNLTAIKVTIYYYL